MDGFMERVWELKRDFHIEPSKKQTTEDDARRITILVVEEFLKHFRETQELNHLLARAAFLEADLFHALKNESFRCDAIPNEEISHIPIKERKGFNPLKVHEAREGKISDLAIKIIDTLKGKTDHGYQHQTNFEAGRITSIFQDLQKHAV